MSRVIRLHAFCSVKGGVGKSTLAIVSAVSLSRQGRRAIVIDADLTGTSLADGLKLCAPIVPLNADGNMDLIAPSTGKWLTLNQTEALRDARKGLSSQSGRRLLPPPFLNDVLLHRNMDSDQDCQMSSVLWKSLVHPELQIIPASSIRYDVNVALGWLYQEERVRWSVRLAWILMSMAQQMPDLTDVIFDLPPGLFGFAQAVLSLFVRLSDPAAAKPSFPIPREHGISYEVNSFLVTTPDRSALLASVEEFLRLKPQIMNLGFLINRTQEGIKKVRKEISERFGQQVTALGIEQELRGIDDAPLVLGRLFQGGTIEEPEFIELLGRTLRLG